MNKKEPKPEPLSDLIDIYARGLEAAHTGRSQAQCPYDYATPEGEQWVQGYQDGGGTD